MDGDRKWFLTNHEEGRGRAILAVKEGIYVFLTGYVAFFSFSSGCAL